MAGDLHQDSRGQSKGLISAARAEAITHREFRIGGNSSWATQLQKQPDGF